VVFDARRGLIITNSHVIDHANEITVKLTDGRALPARRVGADSETEVAVIQVRADVLTELPFGNTDRLEVGDFVFAIGNPQKIGQTVRRGSRQRFLRRFSVRGHQSEIVFGMLVVVFRADDIPRPGSLLA
jgi:S1-C subfamily serine protease